MSDLLFKLSLDLDYIDKSRKSICRNCKYNLGWKEDYYDCKISNKVKVEYKREGLFHSEIIKCSGFENK